MGASCAGCETNFFSLKSTQKLLDSVVIIIHPTRVIRKHREGVVGDICRKDGRDEVEKEVDNRRAVSGGNQNQQQHRHLRRIKPKSFKMTIHTTPHILISKRCESPSPLILFEHCHLI